MQSTRVYVQPANFNLAMRTKIFHHRGTEHAEHTEFCFVNYTYCVVNNMKLFSVRSVPLWLVIFIEPVAKISQKSVQYKRVFQLIHELTYERKFLLCLFGR